MFYAYPAYARHQCKGERRAQIRIIIEPVFNGLPLVLKDKYFVTSAGDTVIIDAFKFYLTNLKFSGDGFVQEISQSHLFDASDTTTATIFTEGYPDRQYRELDFTVGVDSILNTSGANDGDLDPIKGMYWTWNSGYIMAKLEGRANACITRNHEFEYHIGGYMPPYNTARGTIHLSSIFKWGSEDDKNHPENLNKK